MKALMTFNRIFLALALLTSATSQTVGAANTAPDKQATQDPFDSVNFFATHTEATMLDVQASDASKKPAAQENDNQEQAMVDSTKARLYLAIEQEHEHAVDNAIADMEKYEENNNDDTGIDLDDLIETASNKAKQRILTGNPSLICEQIPQQMIAVDNKAEKGTSSSKEDKPFVCPADQCNMHCFSADGLVFHMLSIHCKKVVDSTPTRMPTIKIGDLACTCNAKKDDRVCRICRCTDRYTSYAAAGMQPPPPCDEKISDLDGPFTCDCCGTRVNKYTCYTHLKTDCPKKSVATVTTPSAMEESHE